jgi:hypothetical protein
MTDDDLEDRLRAALRMHAAEAPRGTTMLSDVATESAHRGRRARLGTLAAGVAVLVALGAALPLAQRGGQEPAVVAEPPVRASASASASPAPALVPATVPIVITFPYSPPSGPGYGSPMVTLVAGRPTLVQDLPPDNASATLTLDDARPAPPTSKSLATETKVNGRPAVLYEWQRPDSDDPQYTLVWQPAATTWLSLTEGSNRDLTGYAEALRPGLLKVQAPFEFGLMPAGWTVDNISASAVTFCPPGVAPDATFVDKITVMLDESPGTQAKHYADGTVTEVKVGARRGWLSESADGQTLQVPTDGGRSLLLQIGPKALLPLDVLLAFAASITVTPAAEVSRG